MENNGTVEVTHVRRMVTPEEARLWLQDNRYPYQRRLSEPRVKEFITYLENGEWSLDTIRFHEVGETGWKRYLSDGQHRLTAVDRWGKPAPFIVRTDRVLTMDQLRSDYGNIDTPKLRTIQDILPGTGLSEISSLSDTQLSRVASAVRLIGAEFRTIQAQRERVKFRSNTYLIEQMKHWVSEASRFYTAIDGATPGLRAPLQTQPVLSVALVTFRYQPEKADSFWTRVAQNDGLCRGEAEWLLNDFVRGPNRQRKDATFTSRYIAGCWNAFFRGRPANSVKPVREAPIKIDGTPWKGEKRPAE